MATTGSAGSDGDAWRLVSELAVTLHALWLRVPIADGSLRCRTVARPSDILLAALGALLAGVTIGALALHVPGADTVGSPLRTNMFVGALAIGVAIYLVAVRVVLRGVFRPSTFWIVLGIAGVMRAALLPALPFLSSDVYRYVWDGQVQAAGINPYAHVPADPSLSSLRDPAVFPWINRADYARTIYPPAAQVVFAAVGRVTNTVVGMKIAMLMFEAAALLCVTRLLSAAGLPRERVLIYAWNPLPLWSFALDGHVDAVAIRCLGMALLATLRRRDGIAGGVLAAAALVKFLPVVVAPAFIRGGRFWRAVLAGIAVIALLYLPYLSAGRDMFGFLSSYGGEEGYDTGSGFWLLAGLSRFVALPAYSGRVYVVVAALGFIALALWIVRVRSKETRPDAVALCNDTALLAAYATAVINPHYAWYYGWLALPAVVAPIPAVVWLSSAPVLFYIDPFNERFVWPALVFVPAIALKIRQGWRNGLGRGAV